MVNQTRFFSFLLSVICVVCISSHNSKAFAQGGDCGNVILSSNVGVLIIPKQDLASQLSLDICGAESTFTSPALINSALMALSFKELTEFYLIMSIAYQRLTPEQRADTKHVAGLWAAGLVSFLGAGLAVGGTFYALTSGFINVSATQAKTVRRMVEAATYFLGVKMCWQITKQWQNARNDFLAGAQPTLSHTQISSYGDILTDVAFNAGREGLELGALAGVQLAPLASADYTFGNALVNSVAASVFVGAGVATVIPLIVYATDQLILGCGSERAKAQWGMVKQTFKKYQVAIIGVNFLMYALGFSMSHEIGELLGVEDYVIKLNGVANYLSAMYPVRANMTFWDAVVWPVMQIALFLKTIQVINGVYKNSGEYDNKIRELEGEPQQLDVVNSPDTSQPFDNQVFPAQPSSGYCNEVFAP